MEGNSEAGGSEEPREADLFLTFFFDAEFYPIPHSPFPIPYSLFPASSDACYLLVDYNDDSNFLVS
ncbi:MAG: hypothetical protein F6K41_29605 [Symploca sp. SIO3E6]|nr:hypothetical protein [Caldora sp. SIO3E6]